MSSILLDNWNLEEATNIYKYTYNNINSADLEMREKCWANFLTAFVLWDEIVYNPSIYSYFWLSHADSDSTLSKLFDIIKPLTLTLGKEETDLRQNIINECRGCDDTTLLWVGCIEYLTLSNLYNVSYLPHPNRANYMYHGNAMIMEFSRLDIFEKIDKELFEYYETINRQLGRAFMEFKYPVFYDYIRKNSSCHKDDLAIALELRNDRNVTYFRKSIEDIEKKINSGNTQLLLACLKTISSQAKDITNSYFKEQNFGEIAIGVSPSLNFALHRTKINDNKLHTTFINKLLNFGVYERRKNMLKT